MQKELKSFHNDTLSSTYTTNVAFVHCFSVGERYLPKLLPIHLAAILKIFSSSQSPTCPSSETLLIKSLIICLELFDLLVHSLLQSWWLLKEPFFYFRTGCDPYS